MNFLAFDLGASSGRAILGILKDGKLDLQEIHRFPNGHKTVDGELFWDYPALAKELKEGLKKLSPLPKISPPSALIPGALTMCFLTKTPEK